jgi:hypothetical protein
VGLVKVRGAGQQRLYALNGEGSSRFTTGSQSFAQFRSESFERLDQYLKDLQGRKKGT